MTTDNAFSKAWKTPCKLCPSKQPNLKLFFKEMCDECHSTLYKEALNHIKNQKNETHISER